MLPVILVPLICSLSPYCTMTPWSLASSMTRPLTLQLPACLKSCSPTPPSSISTRTLSGYSGTVSSSSVSLTLTTDWPMMGLEPADRQSTRQRSPESRGGLPRRPRLWAKKC